MVGGSVFHLPDVPPGCVIECAPSSAFAVLHRAARGLEARARCLLVRSVTPTDDAEEDGDDDEAERDAGDCRADHERTVPRGTVGRRGCALLGRFDAGLVSHAAGEGTSVSCSALVANRR